MLKINRDYPYNYGISFPEAVSYARGMFTLTGLVAYVAFLGVLAVQVASNEPGWCVQAGLVLRLILVRF